MCMFIYCKGSILNFKNDIFQKLWLSLLVKSLEKIKLTFIFLSFIVDVITLKVDTKLKKFQKLPLFMQIQFSMPRIL